jgi:hypothetical protein
MTALSSSFSIPVSTSTPMITGTSPSESTSWLCPTCAVTWVSPGAIIIAIRSAFPEHLRNKYQNTYHLVRILLEVSVSCQNNEFGV